MKRLLTIIISAFLVLLPSDASEKHQNQFDTLLASSRRHLVRNEFDLAYEEAFAAMKIAEESRSDSWMARCLCSLAATDIAGTRDSQAWDRAVAAEELARKSGDTEYLAFALTIKAQVCLFADGGPDDNRNEEGMKYIDEALPLCDADGMERYRFEALTCAGQLLVNENRWNKVIDPDIYRRAGEYFEKAQTLAEEVPGDEPVRKIVLAKSRYLRQGGKYQEALLYCKDMLDRCGEDDNMMSYQIYDQMTNLYSELDSTVQAIDCHRNTVSTMIAYMRQKSDDKLQQIEASYQAEIKDHKIKILWYRIYALLASLVLTVVWVTWLIRRIRRSKARNLLLSATNRKLTRDNEVKEQVISFLSPDISSPDQAQKGVLARLSEECLFLDKEEQICKHCAEVLSAYNVSPEVATFITDSMVSRRKRAEMMNVSPREIQVIHLCRQGLSSAEIAEKLFISVNTVSTHKRNIYSKLEAGNTAEMIKKSLSIGLL